MSAALDKIIRKLGALHPHPSDLQPAMERQRDRIKIRALAGLDVNGFPFRPKKDGSASHLTRTGNLLRSLQADVRVGDRGMQGRVSVTGRARAYAPFVNAARRFLGASIGDRQDVISDLRSGMLERRKNA